MPRAFDGRAGGIPERTRSTYPRPHRRRLRASLAVVIAATALAGLHTATGPGPAAPAAVPVVTLAAVPTSIAQTLTTAYPIPGGAIFMSPSGSDGNPGTAAAPVRSLARATSLAPSGGTVVLRGGVYRDGGVHVSKTITLQSYPHETVWIDGTTVVTGWASTGTGQWTLSNWSTPSFCNGHYYDRPYLSQNTDNTGPCTHIDMARDPANPAAGDPQMLFVNGVAVPEVTTAAAATGNHFFYDQAARRFTLGVNPSGALVEAAARPVALWIAANNVVVRGIGFRRFATNEYDNATNGALVLSGNAARVDHVVFTQQAAGALLFTGATNPTVTQSYFYRNGFNAIHMNGHQHSTGVADNLLVTASMIDGQNTELFGRNCSLSCAAAGSKLAHMDGFTIRGNIIQNTQGVGHGFWCDLACSGGVIVDNIVRNNGGSGIFYEVSNTGIIASNLIYGNGAYGIRVGSANTQIYNNTMYRNGSDFLIYDDKRSYGVNGWTDVGPDTENIRLGNNVTYSTTTITSMQLWRTSSVAPNTGPSTFMAASDYDDWYRPGGSPKAVRWLDGTDVTYASIAALTAARGFEHHAHDITSGGDPFFVDAATGVFRIRSGSPASSSGELLPSAVAAAIGVPAAAGYDRGALAYPGRGGNVTPSPTPAPTSTPTATSTATPTPTPVPAPVTLQGESLTGTGVVIHDTTASGGAALAMWWQGTASGHITLAATSHLTVRVRGQSCGGAPEMRVSIDGTAELTVSVTATSWATYGLPAAVGAGTHTVAITYPSDVQTSTCDRNLFVDVVTATAT